MVTKMKNDPLHRLYLLLVLQVGENIAARLVVVLVCFVVIVCFGVVIVCVFSEISHILEIKREEESIRVCG